MAVESKFERVEADSPLRCQGKSATHGQCPFKRCENSQYCPMHGGMIGVRKAEEERKRLYRLGKYQTRVNEIADHDQTKSLREEIGITRMVLEEIVSACNDGNDIIFASSKISDLVTKIEKLVSSCHRLEESTGVLLDKSAALHLASVMVGIIGKYVEDSDAIERISQEIAEAIAGAKPVEKIK
jgi:hypothetical protein